MKFKKSHLDFIIGERVGRLLRERGLLKKPFAESIDMSPSQFRALLAGTRRWNTSYIDIIAEKLGLKPQELLFPGLPIEEVCTPTPAPLLSQEIACPNVILSSEVKGRLEVPLQDYYAAPLIDGTIAAGEGFMVGESLDIEDIISLVWIYAPALRQRRSHGLFAVEVDQVNGDSMMPTIWPGDIVLIDRSDPGGDTSAFKSGKIYAVRDGKGGCAVKRVYRDDENEMMVISSDNRDYPPRLAWTQELGQLIIGRVVWGWRNLLDV